MPDLNRDHIYCFVPSEDIGVIVLATYLKAFIDGTATIKASHHPRDSQRLGYTVGASTTLAREALEDVIKDTRDWVKEQQYDEFQDAPYSYRDSDTWQSRQKTGPTRTARNKIPLVTAPRGRKTDVDKPRTFSEVSSSTQSTTPLPIFSRDGRSQDSAGTQYTQQSSHSSRHVSGYRDESIKPSDSASQTAPSNYQRQTPRYVPNYERPTINNTQTNNSARASDKKCAGRDGRQEGDREGHGGDPAAGGPRDVPDMMAADLRPGMAYGSRGTNREDNYAGRYR
jgi:hypothetical protein